MRHPFGLALFCVSFGGAFVVGCSSTGAQGNDDPGGGSSDSNGHSSGTTNSRDGGGSSFGSGSGTTGSAASSAASFTGGVGSPMSGSSRSSTAVAASAGGSSTSVTSRASSSSSSGSSSTSDGGSGQGSPQQVVKLMSPGWNLGNSFDGSPKVTSWGNPAPTQALIDAVHAAGFKTLRLPVTWTDHIGAAPSYTVDSAWMAQVAQTAQWAVDAGMYVFVNTHHEADGNGGWVSFPSSTTAAQSVAAEVKAVWTQIASAFKSFDSRLMFECFNEPNEAGTNDAQSQADLNLYLEACVNAIRGTGGANATRIVMIQPIGASPVQAGIQAMQQASIIQDPNLMISLHTYYPTNFGLSTSPYAWGSSSDYTTMQNSIAQQIRSWLPTQPVCIGEWGSMEAQATPNRAAHAVAYAQDVTTAGMVPIWWDNGGSASSSFALFDRNTGAQLYPTIVSGIMTGVKNGQAAPNTWATLANP